MSSSYNNSISSSSTQSFLLSGAGTRGNEFNREETVSMVQPNSVAPPPNKRRNQSGNPNTDVIVLSPKTIITTNRFICEICNKGFQIERNLQLHRSGHNLPWKLKKKPNKKVRRKVYLSPEPKSSGIWEPKVGASSASASASESAYDLRDSLALLYRPPFHLMFHGTFEQAKTTSSSQNKWLLVNLQSNTEFSSHLLNRDTWANEVFSQTIKANFIFWQTYNDTTEGRNVFTYYKLESIPVVLVIHPITGQMMRMWSGMVGPETLLEDLVPYMDGGPHEHFTSHGIEEPKRGDQARPK